MKSIESDKVVVYTVVAIMAVVAIVTTIIIMSITSPLENFKNTDLDFIIEQSFLRKSNSKDIRAYETSGPVEKLKILEEFKQKNPDSIKIANEIVSFNSSNVITKDPVIKQIVEEGSNNACKSVVAKSLSMPINITVEITPKNIKKVVIHPFVRLNESGVIVDIENSIMPVLSKDNDYNKLNSGSKNKIVNILKEKIINDINSKYKKATVSLSFAKLNL